MAGLDFRAGRSSRREAELVDRRVNVATWRGIAGILVGLGVLYGVLDTVIPFAAVDLGFTLTSTTLPDGASPPTSLRGH